MIQENGLCVANMAGKKHHRTILKPRPMLRKLTSDDNAKELLDLLRSQEGSLDETVMKETRYLLSLPLDRTTMPSLPSIARAKEKKKGETTKKLGIKNNVPSSSSKHSEKSTGTTASDEEVSDVSSSHSFITTSNDLGKVKPRYRLPSLDSCLVKKTSGKDHGFAKSRRKSSSDSY